MSQSNMAESILLANCLLAVLLQVLKGHAQPRGIARIC